MFYTNFLHRAFPNSGTGSRTLEAPRPPREVEVESDTTRSRQLAHEQAMHTMRAVQALYHLERHTSL